MSIHELCLWALEGIEYAEKKYMKVLKVAKNPDAIRLAVQDRLLGLARKRKRIQLIDDLFKERRDKP